MGFFGKIKRGVARAGKSFLKQSPKVFGATVVAGGIIKQSAPIIGLAAGIQSGNAKTGFATAKSVEKFGKGVQKVGGVGLAASVALQNKNTFKRKLLGAAGKEIGRRVAAEGEKRLRTMYDQQKEPAVDRNVAGFINT